MSTKFYLTLLLFNCFLSLGTALTIKGNLITDLETNDAGNFAAEAANWKGVQYTSPSASQDISMLYDQCDSTYFLGLSVPLSFGGTFTRVYKDLPPHEIIYYSIEAIMLDQWLYDSSVILLFDKMSYGAGVFLMNHAADFPTNVCGNAGDKDLPGVKIFGKAEHTGKKLEFSVYMNTHSYGSKYLGFRNLRLLFRNKTDDEEEGQMCGRAPGATFNLNNCFCNENQFEPFYHVCQGCHTLCKTCLGSLPSQCPTCADNAFFNGTECVECHPSCETCSGPGEDECLTCDSSDYYLTNSLTSSPTGGCVSDCSFPLDLDMGPPVLCFYNCGDDKFLYPNGDCKDNCPFVFHSFTQGGKKFCYEYCDPGDYYIPSASSSSAGTCVPSGCPAGYFQDDGPRYCHPCEDSSCVSCVDFGLTCVSCQYGTILNTDGVCQNCQNLEITYVRATSNGHEYEFVLGPNGCNLTATAIEQHLAGTSQAIQDFPSFSFQANRIGFNTYRILLILEGSVMEQKEMSITLAHLNGDLTVPKTLVPSPGLETLGEYMPAVGAVVTGTIGASVFGAVALGASASLWSIVNFQQFVGYFLYLNTEFPAQLEMFFSILEGASFSFLPNPFAWFTDSVKGEDLEQEIRYQPPKKFAKHEITSFFIENSGGVLFLNLLLLLVLLFVQFLLTRKKYKNSWILKKIHSLMKWNIVFRCFLENGIPLILGIFLQFRIMIFQKTYVILCCLGAIFGIFYIAVMVFGMVQALWIRSVDQLRKDYFKEKYGTLYEGVKLESPESKYYNVLILFRGMLLSLLIAYIDKIPILQIVPLIIFNMGLVYYLFRGVCFEDKNMNYINRVKEVLILCGEVFILFMNFRHKNETYYNALGWLTVFCFVTALLIELAYLVIQQILGIRKIKQKVLNFWKVVCTWLSNTKRKRNKVQRVSPESSEFELKEGVITQNELARAFDPRMTLSNHSILSWKDSSFNIEPPNKRRIARD